MYTTVIFYLSSVLISVFHADLRMRCCTYFARKMSEVEIYLDKCVLKAENSTESLQQIICLAICNKTSLYFQSSFLYVNLSFTYIHIMIMQYLCPDVC